MAPPISDGVWPRGIGTARVALLTQHGKEAVLEPLFRAAGFDAFVTVRGFDTDQLGSFSGEIPRTGAAVDTAREKAKLALRFSRLEYGLGSEGTFGPGPLGISAWDTEVLVLLHASGLQIVGYASGPALHRQVAVDPSTAAGQAALAGFPSHGLLVRPDPGASPIAKGVRELDALERAVAQAMTLGGTPTLETDLRAHQNPTRLQVIARAGEDLLATWKRRCPCCDAPGFAIVRHVPGLPCEDCHLPTELPRAEVLRCSQCAAEERRPAPHRTAPARFCQLCNP